MFRPPERPRPQQENVHNMNQQLTRLPEVHEVGSLLVQGAKQFAVRNKYITAWYLFGVLIIGGLIIAGGGKPLSRAQRAEYNRILSTIDVAAEYDALDAYAAATHRYRATRGWFWSCDSVCQRYKQDMKRAEHRLMAIKAESNARMSHAKSVAGLFSDVAVDEMTDSFWQNFAAGKRFAKRQTGWDIMWMAIRGIARGRDESWGEYAIKIIMHILINFTMGLLSALLFFVLGLWNILRSYQPNPIVAVIVFLSAAAAATSFVLTYLMALFGAAAGGVYGVAKLAESAARAQLNADPRQQQRQRVQQQRPHHD
jgi:hypothetical protein